MLPLTKVSSCGAGGQTRGKMVDSLGFHGISRGFMDDFTGISWDLLGGYRWFNVFFWWDLIYNHDIVVCWLSFVFVILFICYYCYLASLSEITTHSNYHQPSSSQTLRLRLYLRSIFLGGSVYTFSEGLTGALGLWLINWWITWLRNNINSISYPMQWITSSGLEYIYGWLMVVVITNELFCIRQL